MNARERLRLVNTMISEGKVDPINDDLAAKTEKVATAIEASTPTKGDSYKPQTYAESVETLRNKYQGMPFNKAFEDIMANRSSSGGNMAFTPDYINALNDSGVFPYKFEVRNYNKDTGAMTWGVGRELKGFSKDPKMGGGWYYRKWYKDGTYDELDPNDYANQLDTYKSMPEEYRKSYKEYFTPEMFEKEKQNQSMYNYNTARRLEYINQFQNQSLDAYNQIRPIRPIGI